MSWGLRLQIKELLSVVKELELENANMREALAPFAELVHDDGVEAPYPENVWAPLLIAAKEALR